MIFWFFGLPGVGKDYCARVASKLINAVYVDVDNFLTEKDKQKLVSGTFSTQDRLNKLRRTKHFIDQVSKTRSIVVADSLPDGLSRKFLRKNYKDIIFILVEADPAIHKKRLRARKGHFFTQDLLDNWASQHWQKVKIPHVVLNNNEDGEQSVIQEFKKIYEAH